MAEKREVKMNLGSVAGVLDIESTLERNRRYAVTRRRLR